MKRVFKIALICLLLGICGLNVFLLGDTIYKSQSMEVLLTNGDQLLLAPMLIILNIPSIIFNIKTLSFYKPKQKLNPSTLDGELLLSSADSINIRISKFLWIGNLLFGLAILILGMIFLNMVLKNPSDNIFSEVVRFLFSSGIFLIGIWILVEEWKMKRVLQKNQSSVIKTTQET